MRKRPASGASFHAAAAGILPPLLTPPLRPCVTPFWWSGLLLDRASLEGPHRTAFYANPTPATTPSPLYSYPLSPLSTVTITSPQCPLPQPHLDESFLEAHPPINWEGMMADITKDVKAHRVHVVGVEGERAEEEPEIDLVVSLLKLHHVLVQGWTRAAGLWF